MLSTISCVIYITPDSNTTSLHTDAIQSRSTTTTTTTTTKPTTTTTKPNPPEDNTTYNITLWVSTIAGVKEFTQEQVYRFQALHPEYKFNITILTVGVDDAASKVLEDIAEAPDMYCFAPDQISRLVFDGALAKLGVQASRTVTEENDAGSVNAVTVGDGIYAYPMISNSNYYLYYDSSKISDEEAKTLEGIVAACQREGVKFGYNLTNALFMAGFFFSQPVGGGAPLCTCTWTYSKNGDIVRNDNFNSANGLVAMKAMNWLANSGVWIDSADNFAGTGAIVTGLRNAKVAEAEYGDNMKAAKLPTFIGSDGVTYQMGSVGDYQLIGCKPQEDPMKAKICSELALYLTSEEVQLERYYEFQYAPSNVAAQSNPDVLWNRHISAPVQQNAYAQSLSLVPSWWWTTAGTLGEKAAQTGLTDEDLIAALKAYGGPYSE